MGGFLAMTSKETAERLKTLGGWTTEEDAGQPDHHLRDGIRKLYRDALRAVVLGAQDARLIAMRALEAEKLLCREHANPVKATTKGQL